MEKSMTVAVDLAKDVFELAVADERGRIIERQRLSRSQFARFFENRVACPVVMEACGSAHYWARLIRDHGHTVRLLPPQYVRPYRRRNKTDRSDCEAILEASRNREIREVPIKQVEQQVIQGLHRVRTQWMATRTNRINVLRGLLRELGIAIPLGATTAIHRVSEAVETLPARLQPVVRAVLDEIRELEERVDLVDTALREHARLDADAQCLIQVSGIGVLTATAMAASVVDPRFFRNGRQLSSWVGLTPREHSSGNHRHLGGISKCGDVYLRMLLTHGARSVLNRAKQLHKAGKPLNRLQHWAVELEQRRGHNKATCALANKIARIAWATWRHQREFDGNYAVRKQAA